VSDCVIAFYIKRHLEIVVLISINVISCVPHCPSLMRMNDLESLQEMYPYDHGTRTFTIPISIERYEDFSLRLDPSPASKRDLAPDLVDYLRQCSDEIPCRYPIKLKLNICEDKRDSKREQNCLDSLKNYFQHEIFVERSDIRHRRADSLKYLLVSFLFLTLYIVTEKLLLIAFFSEFLREAVLIGGWLFMWEAVSVNFIEMDKHYETIKKLNRLIQAKYFSSIR